MILGASCTPPPSPTSTPTTVGPRRLCCLWGLGLPPWPSPPFVPPLFCAPSRPPLFCVSLSRLPLFCLPPLCFFRVPVSSASSVSRRQMPLVTRLRASRRLGLSTLVCGPLLSRSRLRASPLSLSSTGHSALALVCGPLVFRSHLRASRLSLSSAGQSSLALVCGPLLSRGPLVSPLRPRAPRLPLRLVCIFAASLAASRLHLCRLSSSSQSRLHLLLFCLSTVGVTSAFLLFV